MQPLLAELLDDERHFGRVRYGLVRIGAPWRLGGIVTVRAPYVIQALGAIVVWCQRVVVNRPGRRQTVDMFDRLEVLPTEPVEHAAPELRVSADAVVRVRRELASAVVQP